MIVTVVSEGACEAKVELAERLAALRGLTGRKVLLMDAGSQPHRHPPLPVPARAVNGKGVQAELENLGLRFQDIIVDADGRDSLGSRAALIAAGVVVVPGDGLEATRAARLAERIGNARLFNPGLRIVIAGGSGSAPALLIRALPGAELAASGDAVYDCVFRR